MSLKINKEEFKFTQYSHIYLHYRKNYEIAY